VGLTLLLLGKRLRAPDKQPRRRCNLSTGRTFLPSDQVQSDARAWGVAAESASILA
jgi:hypothetical protein